MPRKTSEQVTEQVAKLIDLLPVVRRFSKFGDDNHAQIHAAMAVLSEGLDSEEVYRRYGNERDPEFNQDVLDTAVRACDWMEGRAAASEPGPADEGWPLAADAP